MEKIILKGSDIILVGHTLTDIVILDSDEPKEYILTEELAEELDIDYIGSPYDISNSNHILTVPEQFCKIEDFEQFIEFVFKRYKSYGGLCSLLKYSIMFCFKNNSCIKTILPKFTYKEALKFGANHSQFGYWWGARNRINHKIDKQKIAFLNYVFEHAKYSLNK